MQIIHQIETHPFPPISLDNQQADSLTKKVNLLQEFLEGYDSPFSYSNEADPLEMRIADAAYAPEDVIESYIVDNIELQVEENSHIIVYEDVQKVREEMDLLVRDVTEMVGEKAAVQRSIVSRDAGFRSNSSVRKSVMVGFDDLLLDRLTGGRSNSQIIPIVGMGGVGKITLAINVFENQLIKEHFDIVGMGGVGKTTLAINVFENQLIEEHFDICVWATISQNYDIQETLVQVLSQVRGNGR